MPRKSIPAEIRRHILHEAGYKCANPACRTILTLDIHHLDPVSDDGANTPENLIALCPTCHSLHHAGKIPISSLRTWKLLLLSLNEAYDRKSIDILIALAKMGQKQVQVSGDGVLLCAALIAGGLVEAERGQGSQPWLDAYRLSLTQRGGAFVEAWKDGDQEQALRSIAGG
ncbi:MAG: HNH endonuclease [Armatimonadetes bacterium]|nr:HNH endonuclease [Armatimonadota bacterium]